MTSERQLHGAGDPVVGSRLGALLRLVDQPGAVGETVAALRAWRDAQVARDAAERKLLACSKELAASAIADRPSAEEPAATERDGWAPRDLPLLPSPIHRQLLDPLPQLDPPAGDVLSGLPESGTMPDIGYMPFWRRSLASLCGRLVLAVAAFLAIPQRRINARLAARLAALEAQQVAQNAAFRDALAGLAERTLANFLFLDGAQREQLLEIHRQAARQRSELRGEVARQAETWRHQIRSELDAGGPRYQLALLELELAVAEARSQSAWQRVVAAELDERIAAAEKALAAAAPR